MRRPALTTGQSRMCGFLFAGIVANLGITCVQAEDGASLSARWQQAAASSSHTILAQAAPLGDGAAPAVTSSRESLFGTSEPFGNKPLILSGIYDFGLAYTFASPAHWSRAVNRLRVTGQGASGELKYKFGGQFTVDPVYFSTHYYRDDVRRNQRVDFVLEENYVDFSVNDWDFRFGAQHIVWGEVVGLFVADVVSARDSREFLLQTFDLIRIPQWAARAERSFGDSHVELVWVPIQTFDRIGKPGADFYPLPLPSPLTEAAASIIDAVERPSRRLSNSNFGVRANTLYRGWDLAAFYYRSFSTEPTFFRSSATGDPNFKFTPGYDRIWQGGVTVSKDFDTFVMRGEAVYAHGRNWLASDPAAPHGVVQRQTLDYILGVEMPVGADTRFNFQAFQRVYSGERGDVLLDTGEFGLSVFASTKLTAALEPQILWIQGINGGGGMIRPRINWKPDPNWLVAFGIDVFTGGNNTFFGRFNNRDRVYTEVRFNF